MLSNRTGSSSLSKPPFVGEKVKLSELCNKGKSTLRQKDLLNDGPYPVYGASGVIGAMSTYQNASPYVCIVKDGAGVGRVMPCQAKSSVLGTMQALIPKEGVSTDYLLHLVRSLSLGEGFSGSTIPHIYFKDYGKRLVPSYSLNEQREIVRLLNRIEKLVAQQSLMLNWLDQLIKSRFVEMFGDPNENPCGWRKESLLALGDCKNGMNYRADDSGYTVLSLGVADFKNRAFLKDMSLLSEVSIAKKPKESYLLKDGDILFVRSNGNKKLVGRCLAVFPGENEVIFSGFCIRLRLHDSSIRMPFLLWTLKQPSIRRQMFGRGANVQNLNQEMLCKVQVPLPPLDKQDEFLNFVAQVDKSRFVGCFQAAKAYPDACLISSKYIVEDKLVEKSSAANSYSQPQLLFDV